MWFLLLQISLLLLVAALLGAMLAWWWMKRRYEDVTESHEKLLMESNSSDRLAQLSTREDVREGIAALSTSMSSSIEGIKPVDIGPVHERLNRIEQFLTGLRAHEIAPIGERLKPIEARLAAFSLDPVNARISELANAVSQKPMPDFAPIERRLVELEQTIRSIRIPAPDLGPVHSGIATLQLAVDKMGSSRVLEPVEGRMAAIEGRITLLGSLEKRIAELGDRLDVARRTDHESVANRLASVTNAVGSLRNADLEPVVARLASVEQAIANFHIPATDLRPLNASMIDLERAVMALDKPPAPPPPPPPPVDLAPVNNRLAALQASLASVQSELRNRHALEAIERRVASLQEAVQGMPETDLAPVMGAMQSMESRMDLGALENRLTAIEYGLAALHHSMRARPEAVMTRTDTTWQGRPDGPIQRLRSPSPQRPPREADPINAVRREEQANLLTDPAFGPPDDLEQIHGVGPMLRELLNEIGVYYFWQVAEWTPDEAAFVDSRLMHFRGRIRRDDWIEHARVLAAAPSSARRPAAWDNGRSL